MFVIVVNIEPVMSCSKCKLLMFVSEIQRVHSLADARDSVYLLVFFSFYLLEKSNFRVLPCRARCEYPWVMLAVTSSIDVLRIVDIFAPVDLLDLLTTGETPNLDLVLGSIAACEDLSVLIIEGIP